MLNGFPVAFGGLLLLGGRLSDLFGAKRIFTAGWVVLLVGSVLCALAGSPGLEIGPAQTNAAAVWLRTAELRPRQLWSHERVLNRHQRYATGSATMHSMTALHVRNLPESVVTALRERAARHGQSMQQEIRQ
ncbi:MAG: FitA-like ribbon-helix-helix domain-containing protein, partial [Solirubrobacteraceae bacterium]